ncbi:hypothetical protein CN327_25485 [Bacillus cereus]|nr:hypothetical protein CN327_25485 [Bacillus cereus]
MNSIKVSTITVKQLLDGISNKDYKIRDVAEAFGKEFNREGKAYSDRAIQSKISSLGYKWNPKNAVYEAVGEAYKAENDSLLFADLFKKNPIKQAVTVAKESQKNTNTKTVSSQNSTNNKRVTKGKGETTNNSTVDSIDSILFGKQKAQRVQRAYYLDKDLADIIDKIEGKQKSNLVNDCIRKVFEEKGIL